MGGLLLQSSTLARDIHLVGALAASAGWTWWSDFSLRSECAPLSIKGAGTQSIFWFFGGRFSQCSLQGEHGTLR